MTVTSKIKCEEKPKPNCEVIVKEGYNWEKRYVKDGMVYAYHQGYLWPQRKIEQYHKFRYVVFAEVETWDTFEEVGNTSVE